MATTIGKKKTTRRKPGAKKASGRKRKSKVAGSPATLTVSGKRFTKAACGLTKPEAQKRATSHRSKGASKQARVVPNAAGKGYCLYKRG